MTTQTHRRNDSFVPNSLAVSVAGVSPRAPWLVKPVAVELLSICWLAGAKRAGPKKALRRQLDGPEFIRQQKHRYEKQIRYNITITVLKIVIPYNKPPTHPSLQDAICISIWYAAFLYSRFYVNGTFYWDRKNICIFFWS